VGWIRQYWQKNKISLIAGVVISTAFMLAIFSGNEKVMCKVWEIFYITAIILIILVPSFAFAFGKKRGNNEKK
jgi:glycopeptide antibiotics resistance protein